MSTDIDEQPRTPAAPEDPPPPAGTGDRDVRWWAWTVVLPLVVVLCAGVVRFHQLGEPERCYFDETYYYYDARDYLEVGVETSFAVHPPVGKWIIAGGLAAFGVDEGSPVDRAVTVEDDNCAQDDDEEPNPAAREREAAESFARRVMAAFVGTGAVAVAYFVGLRLFRRRSAALLGAGLLAVEGLAVTMSRIAMLDIFLQFFVLLGVLALLIDRDRLWEDAPDHPFVEGDLPADLPRRDRRWLWLAGLFFGLAVATKWSGLAPLGLAWAWVLGSEVWWRRRLTGRWSTDLVPAISRGFLALVLVPVMVYLVSYTGWFANFEDTRKADRCIQATDCTGLEAVGQVAGGWWEEQQEIFRFHRDLEAEHPYRAPATTWALMTRPVAYYYESCPTGGPAEGETCETAPGTVAEVLGMGNPAIWWMALIGYPWLLWLAVARRSWPAMTIALFLFGQWLPYLVSPRPVFLFYLTPAVPFIALTLAYLADEALDSISMRWVPATITVVALAGFVFWAPVFLGIEIPRSTWDVMILFDSWV